MYENKIELKYDIQKDINIKCNSSQIKQLVAILIDNAIKHSETNGKISIALKKQKNDTVLTVSNRGKEIPKEIREKIFERFYREDESRNRDTNRYGLGLAIAKNIVEKHNGILIPAHVFTPHKSYYGNCTDRLENVFKEKFDKIFAIELGLSSDTYLADTISELETITFLTNSDAHSLPKIAREYNKMLLGGISYKELIMALKGEGGRKIIANYGLDPKLGKYHRTYCEICGKNIEGNAPVTKCDTCDSRNITMGVFDRIEIIKDKPKSISPENRPEYIYQIPLNFIPGIGKKTLDKLLDVFENEMNILHKVSKDDIEGVVGEKVANAIINAREGKIKIQEGGGGVYGKITCT